MTTKIEIPDFNFSGFYYPELLEDLIQYLRVNCPEITDESPEEPLIQLVRAMALTGHLNNVLLDMVAKERFLPTAQLRQSVMDHLALIGYKLKQASPAVVEVAAELSAVFNSVRTVIPAKARFATMAAGAAASVSYEVLSDLGTIDRPDQFSSLKVWDESASTWTTLGALAATALLPASPAAGDALYIGHRGVMWVATSFTLAAAAVGLTSGVWEFYDGTWDDCEADGVTNNGATLTFDLTTLLGPSNRAGASVRVRCGATGAYEDLISAWDGAKNTATTATFLGQSAPSTTPADYIVGAAWKEVEGLADATATFTSTGAKKVSYTLPQSMDARWDKTTIDGVEAYWLRFRVVAAAGGATPPSANAVTPSSTDKQYVLATATQGESREDSPLGSSTGLPDQSFQLAAYPVLDDSNLKVYVTEGGIESEWASVDNFLNSTPSDKHCMLSFDNDGRATVAFGDGTNGKVPEAGTDNVRAVYRIMDEVDGNVGQNTVTVNKSGVAYISKVWNPRPASGYSPREGSTPEDLARVKVAGPASLRVRERALNPADAEELALAFVSADGSRPIARCIAIEEAYGPKTVELVVAGTSGAAVPQAVLTELQDYFNGNAATKVRGCIVLNSQATVTSYTPKVIDVTATVYGGNLIAITTALKALLSPVATEDDGETWSWEFNSEVPLSRIIGAIMATTPKPRKVVMAAPAGDTALGLRELPVAGAFAITIQP